MKIPASRLMDASVLSDAEMDAVTLLDSYKPTHFSGWAVDTAVPFSGEQIEF